jgi:hypothetical protein
MYVFLIFPSFLSFPGTFCWLCFDWPQGVMFSISPSVIKPLLGFAALLRPAEGRCLIDPTVPRYRQTIRPPGLVLAL